LRKIKSLAVGLVWVGVMIGLRASTAVADSVTAQTRVVVQAVAGDQLSLDVLSADENTASGKPCDISKAAKPEAACPSLHLVVTDNVVKDQLKKLHRGDYLWVSHSSDSAKAQNVLKTIGSYEVSPVDSPSWVLLGSAGVPIVV